MLDFIIDSFKDYLMQGITPDKDKPQSEPYSPNHNHHDLHRLLEGKKNLMDVMSDCMFYLSPEMNLRQFNDLGFIEALMSLINFCSHLNKGIDKLLQADLERQMRICMEIYLSKITDVE